MKRFKRNKIITVLVLIILFVTVTVAIVDYLKYEGVILLKDNSARQSHGQGSFQRSPGMEKRIIYAITILITT